MAAKVTIIPDSVAQTMRGLLFRSDLAAGLGPVMADKFFQAMARRSLVGLRALNLPHKLTNAALRAELATAPDDRAQWTALYAVLFSAGLHGDTLIGPIPAPGVNAEELQARLDALSAGVTSSLEFELDTAEAPADQDPAVPVQEGPSRKPRPSRAGKPKLVKKTRRRSA